MRRKKHSPDIALGVTDEPVPFVVPPGTDPNHHLWQNGRLWWVAFTIHRPDYTAERVRFSLRTDDVRTARIRRDLVLNNLSVQPGCSLSLRFPGKSGGSRGKDNNRPNGGG